MVACGKRVVIGLEIRKGELENLTLYESGPQVVEQEMSRVEMACADQQLTTRLKRGGIE